MAALPGLQPHQVLCFLDRIFTDVLFANKHGMLSVLTQPLTRSFEKRATVLVPYLLHPAACGDSLWCERLIDWLECAGSIDRGRSAGAARWCRTSTASVVVASDQRNTTQQLVESEWGSGRVEVVGISWSIA